MNLILETLFSPNTITATIRVLTLLIYGTMAAVINVTSGINNIGIEGILLSSALVAVVGSWATQSWLVGTVCAVVWGMAISSLFGYLVMKLKTNNILCGLAINMFASGATVFLLSALTGQKGSSISLASKSAPKLSLPLLREIPYVGILFEDYSLFTYLAVFVVTDRHAHTSRRPQPERGEFCGDSGKPGALYRFFDVGGHRGSGRRLPHDGVFFLLYTGHDCRHWLYVYCRVQHGRSNPSWGAFIGNPFCLCQRFFQRDAVASDVCRLDQWFPLYDHGCRSIYHRLCQLQKSAQGGGQKVKTVFFPCRQTAGPRGALLQPRFSEGNKK